MPEREDAMSHNRGVIPESVQAAYEAVEYIALLIGPHIRGWTYQSEQSLALSNAERRKMYAERKIRIRAHTVSERRLDFACVITWGKPGNYWIVKSVELKNWLLKPNPKYFKEFQADIDGLMEECRKAIFVKLCQTMAPYKAGEILASLSRGTFYKPITLERNGG